MSDDTADRPGGYATEEIECQNCGRQCQHHVRIEVVTESENYGGNQPYRFTECQVCGNEEQERIGMGD